MHATSTAERSPHVPRLPAPPETSSRTLRKAFTDLVDGAALRQLWLHLGWQDIKQRYRRSILGPLWITISMAAMVTALGILYAQLLDTSIDKKLPPLAVGFIIWEFIRGCVVDGTEVFIQNEGLMKQLPAPLSVHVFRVVWRQALLLMHNMVIYFAVLIIFQVPVSWTVIWALPALVVILVNGLWVAILFGVVSTRFRDIPPVVQSIMTMALFMTPIMWNVGEIVKNPQNAWRANIAEFNPMFHYIEILRDPLLGYTHGYYQLGVVEPLHHWVIVGTITLVGWALALLVLRNFRARVPYWI